MKLLLATTNKGKIQEYSHLLKDLPFNLVTPDDLGIQEKPEETGKTFEENARIKAHFYAEASGLPALSDDGGLEIDALHGEPGVYSRRWPGYEATDRELAEFALKKLDGVAEEKRTARFRVVLAVAQNPDTIQTFEGSLEGRIVERIHEPIIPGYPFRSVFYYPKVGKVLSDVRVEDLSHGHRERALKAAKHFLRALLSEKV